MNDDWFESLVARSGLDDFASVARAQVRHAVRGRLIPFLGREALITNKRAAGRQKALPDVEALGG